MYFSLLVLFFSQRGHPVHILDRIKRAFFLSFVSTKKHVYEKCRNESAVQNFIVQPGNERDSENWCTHLEEIDFVA